MSGADVGLFYYAGHGLQVDQRNFLAPVDAQLNFEFIGAWVIFLFLFTAMSFAGTIVTAPSLWVGMGRLDFEAVELDLVLKQMVRTPPPASSSSTLAAATNPVIAVEPAASGAAAPANAPANGPAPPTAAAPPPADTKIAAAESKGAEAKEPEAVKATEPPLPGSVAREEVAQDILAELKRLGCYFGRVNGNWSVRSQLAPERFNRLSALELPLDEPQQASLDALKAWKGPHCPIERAVGPRARRPPEAIAVPKQQIGPAHKGLSAGVPNTPPHQAAAPSPRPRVTAEATSNASCNGRSRHPLGPVNRIGGAPAHDRD